MPINSLLCFFVSPLLAQETSESAAPHAPSPIFWIVYAAIMVLGIAAMWKVFTKAGQPGWACIIPIYNLYVLCKIAGRPGWWLILFLIPFVNIIIFIILQVRLAERFGKSDLFAVGLV